MAALKAFLMNRIGDWGLVLALFLVLSAIGDLSLPTLFSLSYYIDENLIFIVTCCILIGAIAKSAQLGLHTWLPQAMAGPTPVSALIHAATMVTAGVYLLLRFSPVFEWSNSSLVIVCWFGALTALFGACSGLVEYDIKKVIAYSTTSQLGYMMACAGLSQYSLSLFHLINHAFFKALLFLSAGAIIHAIRDEQDFRKMGALILFLPRTYSFILLGSLSLMAVPYFTGFYSKDLILEIALASSNLTSTVVYFFTLFAALFTSIYSIRLLLLTFISEPLFPRSVSHSIHDPSWTMLLPLFILGVASVFFASVTYDMILSIGGTLYGNSMFTHPNHVSIIDAEYLPTILKFLPALPLLFLLTIVGNKNPISGFVKTLPKFLFKRNEGSISTSTNMISNSNVSKRNYTTKIEGDKTFKYLIKDSDSNEISSSILSLIIASIFLIFVSYTSIASNGNILELFNLDWSILYVTISDIEAIAHTLYLGYAVAFVLITFVLFLVMVGVLVLLT